MNCPKCGKHKIKKDKQGKRECLRCGPLKGAR